MSAAVRIEVKRLRRVLADCLPGDQVILASPAIYGGTTFEDQVPAGTLVELGARWPRLAPTHVFVHAWSEAEQAWQRAVLARTEALVGEVVREGADRGSAAEADGGRASGVDPSDPLQRRMAGLGDAPLFQRGGDR